MNFHNDDILTRVGERFGDTLADLVGIARTRSVTIKAVDEETNNAMVTIYEDDEPLPVPLSIINAEASIFKIVPTLESTSIIAFANGDENRPYFVNHSQIDRYEIVRGGTSFILTLDPDDEANDTLDLVIGTSEIHVTNEEVNVKTGASTLRMNTDVIEFNSGGLDGLIKINELTDKINGFVDTFNSHVHNVPATTFLIGAQNGVPNPAPIPVEAPTQPAQSFNKGDYENTKITQ